MYDHKEAMAHVGHHCGDDMTFDADQMDGSTIFRF